jgi:hypothetical protein
MRREVAMAAGLMLGFCALSCTRGGAPPPPAPEKTHKKYARVTVTLKKDPNNEAAKCQTRAEPDPIYVTPDGVVEWTIKNKCRDLQARAKPAFEIANLRLKKTDGSPGWAFESCVPRLDHVKYEDDSGHGRPKDNRLFCGVPEDAPEGVYEYDIQGEEIATLDPGIEIWK